MNPKDKDAPYRCPRCKIPTIPEGQTVYDDLDNVRKSQYVWVYYFCPKCRYKFSAWYLVCRFCSRRISVDMDMYVKVMYPLEHHFQSDPGFDVVCIDCAQNGKIINDGEKDDAFCFRLD